MYVGSPATGELRRGKLLQWPSRFTLESGLALLIVVLVPRLGGWGIKFLSRFRLLRRALLPRSQRRLRSHWNLLSVYRMRAQGGRASLLLLAPCAQPFEAAVGQHSVAG